MSERQIQKKLQCVCEREKELGELAAPNNYPLSLSQSDFWIFPFPPCSCSLFLSTQSLSGYFNQVQFKSGHLFIGMKEKKRMPKSIWIADNNIISASNQSMEGKERRQSGIVQHVSYSSRLVSSDMQQTVCFLFNFLLLFGSCLLVCICILFLQSFTPLFSNYHSARFCTSILQLDDSSVCMICGLMCACCYSTLTCSLACAMGLLHDERNTKLSIEQPMDLRPQKKDVINLCVYTRCVSHKPTCI